MTLRPRSIVWPAAAAAALVLAGPARAQLSAVSPFLPPEGSAAAAQGNPNAVEYRGMMSTGHGVLYLIYDPAKKASFWVGLNEPGSPYVVKSDDAEHEKITVQANGEILSLALKEAKVAAGPANPVAVTAPGPFTGTMVGGPVVLRPTPEDEQRRLQAVADEVRRRRLAREQAQPAPAPSLFR